MFENLTDRLQKVFRDLRGYGKLSPENIDAALRQVRLALLEADVNYTVVKEFIATIAARAVGQDVLESLTPGQQVIKIVHQELIELLGGETEQLNQFHELGMYGEPVDLPPGGILLRQHW